MKIRMKPELDRATPRGVGRRLFNATAAVLVIVGLSACAHAPGGSTASAAATASASQVCATPAARMALAPTGALRTGVYRGSPTSYLESPQGTPAGGVGWSLGRALSQKLGVRFEPTVFPNNAAVLAAARQGAVDLVFTNATPARARVIHFASPVMDVEKSVLVPAGSAIGSLDALRGRAVRIGVSAGSSTGEELASIYPAAKLVPVPTLQQAGQMLSQGSIEGFATNKAILFEMADKVPGSHVLAGHWGLEHFAIGIPMGRAAGEACLEAFSADTAREGLLQQAIDQARLQGALVVTR